MGIADAIRSYLNSPELKELVREILSFFGTLPSLNQLTAMGRIMEPVAPLIFRGSTTNMNS